MTNLQGSLGGKFREKEPCGTPRAQEGDGHLPHNPHKSDEMFQKLRCDRKVQATGMEEDGGSGDGGRTQGTREHRMAFAEKKPLNVLGPALSDSSATVSPLLGGRLFSNRNCHLRNFPMSPIIPCFVGSCQLNPSAGRFVISRWCTAPGLSIN